MGSASGAPNMQGPPMLGTYASGKGALYASSPGATNASAADESPLSIDGPASVLAPSKPSQPESVTTESIDT